jgi:hypothetical protein
MVKVSKSVEELLSDFNIANPELADIILKLRNLVLSTSTELEEAVKYGGLVFLKNNLLIGGIFIRKAFVTMEFSFGNELNDSNELLEGTGKLRRNLKFRELSDIDLKKAQYFIDQAYS